METTYRTINVYPKTKEQIKLMCKLLGKSQAETMFEVFHAFFELIVDYEEKTNMKVLIKKHSEFLLGRVIFEFQGSRKIVSGSFSEDSLTPNSETDREIERRSKEALKDKRSDKN